MSNKQPVFRIVATPKDKNRRGAPKPECATIWPAPFEGAFNLSPVMETEDHPKYPKIALIEAITSGEYYLNVYSCGRSDFDDFAD